MNDGFGMEICEGVEKLTQILASDGFRKPIKSLEKGIEAFVVDEIRKEVDSSRVLRNPK